MAIGPQIWIRTGSIFGKGMTMGRVWWAAGVETKLIWLPKLFAIRYSLFAQPESPMQTDNPFLDGMAKLFTDAAGAMQSLKSEVDLLVRQRMEKLVADMNLVPREEFDAVKAMAAKARAENESLAARIAALESKQPTP